MGVLADTKALLQTYPLTFLGVSAAALAVAPVLAVSMAGALRPFAKRIVANAVAIRREARRVAAESKEAYADLVAEALCDPSVAEALCDPSVDAEAPAATRAAAAPPGQGRAEALSIS